MSAAQSGVLLEHYLKQLKLPTMLREYAKLAALCQAERVDYQTFLLRLSEREVHDRELRAADRRLKAAKFPVPKTLDTFKFTAQPSINQELVRELMRGEYIDRRENVLLIGNSGTGKRGSLRPPGWLPNCWRSARSANWNASESSWNANI